LDEKHWKFLGKFLIFHKSLKIRITTSSRESNNQPRQAGVREIKIQILEGNSYMKISV
jgi:hypothetical protein